MRTLLLSACMVLTVVGADKPAKTVKVRGCTQAVTESPKCILIIGTNNKWYDISAANPRPGALLGVSVKGTVTNEPGRCATSRVIVLDNINWTATRDYCGGPRYK